VIITYQMLVIISTLQCVPGNVILIERLTIKMLLIVKNV